MVECHNLTQLLEKYASTRRLHRRSGAYWELLETHSKKEHYMLKLVLNLYGYIIIARALITWLNPSPFNPIVQVICKITDPVLEPVRRMLPSFGGLDFSPMVVLVLIWMLNAML